MYDDDLLLIRMILRIWLRTKREKGRAKVSSADTLHHFPRHYNRATDYNRSQMEEKLEVSEAQLAEARSQRNDVRAELEALQGGE